MKSKGLSIAAVICAAGSSSRMGGRKKEYLPLKPDSPGDQPLTVLGAAVRAFASCPQIAPIIVSLPPSGKKAGNTALSGLLEELRSIDPRCGEPFIGESQGRIQFTEGGHTRRATVYNALTHLEKYNPSYVLIHDGARPWIKKSLIEKVIKAAIQYGAVIPALPMTETPKELHGPLAFEKRPASATANNFIKKHLRRAELCSAQTPQGFKFPEILKAHKKAAAREMKEHFEYTDDAEIWGEFIGKVAVISGDPENRKITYPKDLDHLDLDL